MVPSRTALDLLPHVSGALRLVEQGLQEVGAFDPARLNTSLTIGIDRYCLTLFGATLLSRLRREAPLLRVSLIGAPPHGREDDLRAGRLDFTIGQVWRGMDRIEHEIAFREEFVGLVRPAHPVLSCRRADLLETYLTTPHVLFSEIGHVPRNVDTGLARIGRQRDVRISVPSLDTAAEILLCSDDLMNIGGRVAALLAARYGLRLFELPLEVPSFDVALSWPEQNGDSALTRWFRGIVTECAAGGGSDLDPAAVSTSG